MKFIPLLQNIQPLLLAPKVRDRPRQDPNPKTSISDSASAAHRMGPLPLVLMWVHCRLLEANQMRIHRIRNAQMAKANGASH